jgi:deoxyribodipyrimidine photo-lyase
MSSPNAILWLRRDLRTADHPAFEAAIKYAKVNGGNVLPLFVFDPVLLAGGGANRLAYLFQTLRSLVEAGLPLAVRRGSAPTILAELGRSHSAAVFATGDSTPYGSARDEAAAQALKSASVPLSFIDSNYVIPPGTVRKGDGTPYKVFTPFSKVWSAQVQGIRPTGRIKLDAVPWLLGVDPGLIPPDPLGTASMMQPAGESQAWVRVRSFTQNNMRAYDETRNNPAADLTSRLSADLKYGVVHPRQLLPLIDEQPSTGASIFRTELCWREFYADILFNRPDTLTQPFVSSMAAIEIDTGPVADARFEAWCAGRTGFPFIDAGMRQLLAEGWMHNRVRMAVASFFVKDLHLPWQRGAAWFMRHLIDGDIASNQHGWQWTAGTGTDAAPYFRVFNPISQGQKFDAQGEYIKRWVPELRPLSAKMVHEPWLDKPAPRSLFGGSNGELEPKTEHQSGEVQKYPGPIVDHAAERQVALDRYKALRSVDV